MNRTQLTQHLRLIKLGTESQHSEGKQKRRSKGKKGEITSARLFQSFGTSWWKKGSDILFPPTDI